MATEARLGRVPHDGAGRDAVHVPVIPVTARSEFLPGEIASLVPGTKDEIIRWVIDRGPVIGIVDPFLEGAVKIGQKVWLCLLPGSITSLRHEWQHPAFDDEAKVEASRQWIERFALANEKGYQTVMYAAERWIRSDGDDYLVGGGELEGASVPDEFWEHYERVTGSTVPSHLRYSFFSCACS